MHAYLEQTIPADNNQGFTLVEAIIALCILSFGLLSITAMQLNSSVNVRNAAISTETVAFGTETMEFLMQYPYNDLTNPTIVPNPGNRTSGNYTANWTISDPVVANPAPNTVTITVTVTSPSGQPLTLTSVKADMNL